MWRSTSIESTAKGRPCVCILGRLRFHSDNEYENDNETSLSFSLRFLYTKRWTTRRFHFVVYYNDNEQEPRKNTRNDNVSTQKFRSRTRCRSEILTSLLWRGWVSCPVSAAWHSCVAAYWSKYHCYKQAPSWYDLRCLKATLNPNIQWGGHVNNFDIPTRSLCFKHILLYKWLPLIVPHCTCRVWLNCNVDIAFMWTLLCMDL